MTRISDDAWRARVDRALLLLLRERHGLGSSAGLGDLQRLRQAVLRDMEQIERELAQPIETREPACAWTRNIGPGRPGRSR